MWGLMSKLGMNWPPGTMGQPPWGNGSRPSGTATFPGTREVSGAGAVKFGAKGSLPSGCASGGNEALLQELANGTSCFSHW